jgi:hypothetical protein
MAEPRTTWTKEELWAELDAMGEPRVRELVLMDHFGSAGMVGSKRPLAEEWIQAQDRARQEASEARQASAAERAAAAAERAAAAAERASSAADRSAAAAERQARAAERANRRATIALTIATISAAAATTPIVISFAKSPTFQALFRSARGLL